MKQSPRPLNCVVFGGGGFIGSSIVDALLYCRHYVRVFERPRVAPYRHFQPSESIEWITGDLLSQSDVNAAIDGMDVVYHLVSFTLPKSSNDDPIYDIQTNVLATLQMLNALVVRKVPRIIFISSGGTVYGIPAYLPVDERHPTEPTVSYGITKLTIEKYLLMYQRLHGIRSIILRVANPYGQRQRVETAQGAVGVFLHRALRGLPIEIWGDGTIARDYLHVSDVANAFVSALDYGGQQSVFNIGSGTACSLNQLLDQIDKVLQIKVERRYLPSRTFDVPVNVLSNALAARELKWAPSVELDAGLRQTVDWLRETTLPL
ncbi:MAG: NAD-dependent epimerase/dehydratase family protein [Burkholderiales bacterium]|nr:NAD-dependent epimerase/dehydratase family protein [Burkholderiales bacterium]